ncbi:oxidoreductase [Methylocystis sp.]
MPSLIRFLIIVGAIVAIVYGVMVALVTYVTPQPRQMTYTIPAQRLNK